MMSNQRILSFQSQYFSTVANPPSAGAPTNDHSTSSDGKHQNKSQSNNKEKKDDSNIFLDNLGKIFLSTIALVLLSLLRSTKGNNAKAALRDDIESAALLDPMEIDDLRAANEGVLSKSIWDEIVKEFGQRGNVTYGEFISVVLGVLRRKHGEGATIQCGHLMDRVVIAELERRGRGVGENGSVAELPISFLLTALSLALHSTVADRVNALYDVMVLAQDNTDGELLRNTTSSSDNEAEKEQQVSMQQVEEMIQHLQNTYQLVPDAQIVETNSNVPYQTYRVGDGAELTRRACEGFGKSVGEEDGVALQDFYAILKSRSVCAWGECYVKKTDVMSTSDR